MSRSTIKSEAYLDIVWRQFRKNRAALASLWLLAPVFLVAIFAPLLASDQPLVFRDGEQTIFPGFGRCLTRGTPSITSTTWRSSGYSVGGAGDCAQLPAAK